MSPAVARWFAETRDMVTDGGGDPRHDTEVGRMLRRRAELDPPPMATIADVVAHVDHVREVAGLDHVGIGGDYDGSVFMPVDLQDVSKYPRLFEALRATGWSRADLDQLRADNILRVMNDAQALARY